MTTAPISPKSLEIIRATTPLVKENALKISTTFYPKMLGKNPHLYKYFNEANQRSQKQAGAFAAFLTGGDTESKCMREKVGGTPGIHDGLSSSCPSTQAKTLADAVVAYAANIESLENLSEAVERICEKHCALHIQPEDYLFVHDNFMEAVGEVLGDVVTPEIAAAWSEAVMALANIFIQTEKNLYAVAKEKQWLGVKEFTITDIIDQAIDVKSFRFKAKDNVKTGFVPGQYITIFEKPADRDYFAPRHYTVTSQPEDNYYEVTVKRLVDPADPNNSARAGFYSNYLHSLKVGDTIHCGAIYGPNLLSAGDKSRVAAFVSVGIGITPTKAMLQLAKTTRPNIAVFHGNSDKEHQAFKGLKDEVKQAGGIFTACYSHIEGGERLTGKKIVDTLKSSGIDGSDDKVDFYLCAGNASMCLFGQLVAAGIKRECIHLEYFGPFQSPPEEES